MIKSIRKSTSVNFASGAVKYKSKVISLIDLKNNKLGVVTEETCFHPVDYKWADQSGDKGVIFIKIDDQKMAVPVEDSFIAAVSYDNKTWIYDEVLFKNIKPNEDFYFIVVHMVEDIFQQEFLKQIEAKSEVELHVDEEYRKKLSINHTACHLAALALNKAMLPFWSKIKDVKEDSIGNLDFDKACIVSSKIFTDKSTDKYRLGKSIHKKGLNVQRLISELPAVEVEVNNQLMKWVESAKSSNLTVEVKPEESFLNERREWHCKLPEGEELIPCGGTHVENLSIFKQIKVKIDYKKEENVNNISMDTMSFYI